MKRPDQAADEAEPPGSVFDFSAVLLIAVVILLVVWMTADLWLH